MNIARALKRKNQLAGEVAALLATITNNNVQMNDNTSPFDVKEAYREYSKKVKELVALKTKIARANDAIWSKIFMLVELKGQIKALRTLDTREGTFRERDYGQTLENKFTPVLNARFISEEIKRLQDEIQVLQDDVDDYNYATSIDTQV